MTKTNDITIICDNGGGITLQIVSPTGYRYQHTYDAAEQCATDIKVAEDGGDPAEWDGNEAEGDEANWIEPTGEEIRNGGYRVMSVEEARDLDDEANGWQNASELHAALIA